VSIQDRAIQQKSKRLTICFLAALGCPAAADFCPHPGTVYSTGDTPFSIQVCDLNGDGRPDLVTANADTDTVSVLLRNADGTYAAPVIFATGNEPGDLACCDVDADGDLDIVTVNHITDDVRIHFNNGNAQFTTPGTSYAVGEAPWGVRCLHLNGDARLDIVTANYIDRRVSPTSNVSNVSVLLNNGNGTFAPRVDYDTGIGNGTFSVATCDVDGDGDLDVVSSNLLSSNVSVFRNNGDGTLTKTGTFSVGTNVFPWGIACCDMDGDGDNDVLTAGSNPLKILFNNGSGSFGNLATYTTGLTSPYRLDCCDLDGDGDRDVVVSDLGSNDLRVFLNSGNGTLGTPSSLAVSGGSPCNVVCRDVDSDTDTDVVTCSSSSTAVAIVFENQCASCTTPAQCSDSNPCTTDLCVSGLCEHLPKNCADTDPCTVDTCDAATGNCVGTPVTCPTGQRCFEGSCVPICTTNAECDDGVACTHDACTTPLTGGNVCVHTPDDALCDTGLFCSAEMCDMQFGCVPDDRCLTTIGNPCPVPSSCDEATNTCGGCKQPTMTAAGARYLAVTPGDQGSTPIALKVIGECHDTQSACVVQYVQSKCNAGTNNGLNCVTDANCPKTCSGGVNPGAACVAPADCPLGTCTGRCDAGTLGSTPYYKLSSLWGTAKVRGAQIRPGTTYMVHTECNFGGGAVLSSAASAVTWKWGDVDNNGIVNAIDITNLVNGFKSLFGPFTFEQFNIWACTPDNFLDALDIASDVDAFKGFAFSCPIVCP